MIETWFDPEYKEYFYTREPFARMVDMGDISEQLALKKNLKCKSFDWFMKEVAYDIFEKYPPLPPNKMWGEVKNLANSFCLDTHGRHPPEKVRTTHNIECIACSSNQVIFAWEACVQHIMSLRYFEREKIRQMCIYLPCAHYYL